MLCENISYNPVCDIAPVDQTGFIDLAVAHSMNSVPAMLNAEALEYNEIEDPNSIVFRPSDDFEAMQAGRALLDRVPKQNKSE